MEQEQTYLKGFNDGYKLAKYSPDLYEKLKDSLSADVEYDKGIIAGAEQWQQEKESQRLKELGELDQGKDQEQDLER